MPNSKKNEGSKKSQPRVRFYIDRRADEHSPNPKQKHAPTIVIKKAFIKNTTENSETVKNSCGSVITTTKKMPIPTANISTKIQNKKPTVDQEKVSEVSGSKDNYKKPYSLMETSFSTEIPKITPELQATRSKLARKSVLSDVHQEKHPANQCSTKSHVLKISSKDLTVKLVPKKPIYFQDVQKKPSQEIPKVINLPVTRSHTRQQPNRSLVKSLKTETTTQPSVPMNQNNRRWVQTCLYQESYANSIHRGKEVNKKGQKQMGTTPGRAGCSSQSDNFQRVTQRSKFDYSRKSTNIKGTLKTTTTTTSQHNPLGYSYTFTDSETPVTVVEYTELTQKTISKQPVPFFETNTESTEIITHHTTQSFNGKPANFNTSYRASIFNKSKPTHAFTNNTPTSEPSCKICTGKPTGSTGQLKESLKPLTNSGVAQSGSLLKNNNTKTISHSNSKFPLSTEPSKSLPNSANQVKPSFEPNPAKANDYATKHLSTGYDFLNSDFPVNGNPTNEPSLKHFFPDYDQTLPSFDVNPFDNGFYDFESNNSEYAGYISNPPLFSGIYDDFPFDN